MDESELQNYDVFGTRTQPTLSREVQSDVDGHGPVVFQPERFSRTRD